MAKGSRSKTRKHWASERRRTLGVPVETKQLEEQARRLKESLEKQTAQPSIMKLKAVFKRPQTFTAQPRRPAAASAQREKATPKQPKPAAMETEAAPAAAAAAAAAAKQQAHGEGEEVVEMEVDAKKAKGRKARTVSRVKKSGAPFAAKKQKKAASTK